MNCLECRELLQRRLDGESIASDALDVHLSRCMSCREQHAAAQLVLDALKRTPTPMLPADYARAMAAEVMRDRRQRQRRVRRRVFVTIALAASVLVVLLLAYRWLPPRQDPRDGKSAIVEGPKNELPVKIPADPKDLMKPQPVSPFTKLTDRVADTTREHAKVVLVAANLDGVGKLPDLPDAGNEVTDGVRTVTRSARKAFDFFVRELPMPDIGEPLNHE